MPGTRLASNDGTEFENIRPCGITRLTKPPTPDNFVLHTFFPGPVLRVLTFETGAGLLFKHLQTSYKSQVTSYK